MVSKFAVWHIYYVVVIVPLQLEKLLEIPSGFYMYRVVNFTAKFQKMSYSYLLYCLRESPRRLDKGIKHSL